MRLLCEIFVIGALLYFGWDIPFRDRVPGALTGTRQSTAAPAARGHNKAQTQVQAASASGVALQPFTAAPPPRPQPSTSNSGSWMFDPNHRSPLDPPKHSTPPH